MPHWCLFWVCADFGYFSSGVLREFLFDWYAGFDALILGDCVGGLCLFAFAFGVS